MAENLLKITPEKELRFPDTMYESCTKKLILANNAGTKHVAFKVYIFFLNKKHHY